ncbi:hypothetical protein GCM10010517_09050 [Streptosporangium fragile]|uniref:Uncharacterized protein n=1 Tax=Streptosporangium fragile TaxID=46186 RepID=A0ABN3VR90_9ACTN
MSVAEPYQLLGLARSARLLGDLDRASAHLARAVAAVRATGNEELKEPLSVEEAAILAARGEPVTTADGTHAR